MTHDTLIALTDITRDDYPGAIDTLRKKIQRREVPHVRIGRRINLERTVLERVRCGVHIPAVRPFPGDDPGGETR